MSRPYAYEMKARHDIPHSTAIPFPWARLCLSCEWVYDWRWQACPHCACQSSASLFDWLKAREAP